MFQDLPLKLFKKSVDNWGGDDHEDVGRAMVRDQVQASKFNFSSLLANRRLAASESADSSDDDDEKDWDSVVLDTLKEGDSTQKGLLFENLEDYLSRLNKMKEEVHLVNGKGISWSLDQSFSLILHTDREVLVQILLDMGFRSFGLDSFQMSERLFATALALAILRIIEQEIVKLKFDFDSALQHSRNAQELAEGASLYLSAISAIYPELRPTAGHGSSSSLPPNIDWLGFAQHLLKSEPTWLSPAIRTAVWPDLE